MKAAGATNAGFGARRREVSYYNMDKGRPSGEKAQNRIGVVRNVILEEQNPDC